MLQLRRAEKDFMLCSDIQYLDRFETLHKSFQDSLAALPEADRGRLEQGQQAVPAGLCGVGAGDAGTGAERGIEQATMRDLVHQTEQGFAAVDQHIVAELERQSARLNSLMLVCGGVIVVLIGIMSVLLGRRRLSHYLGE